jgi:hypothetical protein
MENSPEVAIQRERPDREIKDLWVSFAHVQEQFVFVNYSLTVERSNSLPDLL